MTFIPRPQEIYKHFKGNLYQIVAIAEHSETAEQLVIYQALYGDFKTYARPLAMFTSEVDHAKYPEITQRFRFELQGPEKDRQLEATVSPTQARKAPIESNHLETAALFPDLTTLQAEPAQGKSQAAAFAPAEPAPADAEQSVPVKPAPADPEPECCLDPMVLEFLDADSYEQKLNILAGLHHRITDEMITTMAISCDIEVNDGELEERYDALRSCLLTLEKYECNRLR